MYYEDALFSDDVGREPQAPLPEARSAGYSAGMIFNRRGEYGERLFEAEALRHGFWVQPARKDCPDYDALVGGAEQEAKVQIRVVTRRKDLGFHFSVGSRSGLKQGRREAYRGRADFFALGCLGAEGEGWTARTIWYTIPAKHLLGKVQITVRPGTWRTRRGFEPESYRERWHLLAGVPAGVSLVPSLF